MPFARETMRTPREPAASPATIHGRLLPSGEEVRSLSLPKKGLATTATAAPTPATSAKLLGAASRPTSELIFSARLTSNGARNSRHVLMYARAYNTMNRHPTGRTRVSTEPRD